MELVSEGLACHATLMLGGGTQYVRKGNTMKTIVIAAVAALTITAAPAYAFNIGGKTTHNGGDASASAHQGQVQGQAQGQIQGQAQSNSQSVNIDTPRFTYGVFGQIGSSNNSPCGRTFFGIPASGHNCTVRMEAQSIYNAMLPAYGEKRAAQAAVMHLCANDRTMRNTLIAVGVCKLAD